MVLKGHLVLAFIRVDTPTFFLMVDIATTNMMTAVLMKSTSGTRSDLDVQVTRSPRYTG